jgi:hypothetical protein
MTSPVPSSGDAGLVERLRYNAAIWERTAGANHPLCKDQSEAADLIESLTQQQGRVEGEPAAQRAPVPEIAGYVTEDTLREVAEGRIGGPVYDAGTLRPENEVALIRLSDHQSIVSAKDAEIDRTKEEYLRAWNERDAQRRRAEAAEQQLAEARSAPDENGFVIGEPVEKFTGEAQYQGVLVASYLTTKGSRRYVVEVKPQGFQMIASPAQLRMIAALNGGAK